ncbi:MAG: SatD family protein [Bacillota bacterium]|nr:SatD family protein [Bacillota bacterium]
MNYLAIICDIKASRNIHNRKETQYVIINMLKEANILFSDNIAGHFAITAGDEWEGLVYEGCDYHAILEFFNNRLGSVQFYCGIGKGKVTIDDFSLPANFLDGPAFYLARKAVNLAKEMDSFLIYLSKEDFRVLS